MKGTAVAGYSDLTSAVSRLSALLLLLSRRRHDAELSAPRWRIDAVFIRASQRLVAVLREMPSLRLASRTDTSCLSTRRRNLLNVLTLITPAPLC